MTFLFSDGQIYSATVTDFSFDDQSGFFLFKVNGKRVGLNAELVKSYTVN